MVNKPTTIDLGKFKRTKIVQEELVTVTRYLVPGGIQTSKGNKMVEKGNLVVKYNDGTQEVFNDEEFDKVFIPIVDEPVSNLNTRR